MRRSAATAGLVFAASVGCIGHAKAQSLAGLPPLTASRAALRGSQDPAFEPALTLPAAKVTLPPKQVALDKPDAIRRIGATSTLDRLLTLPDQERSPLLSGDPTAAGRATVPFASPAIVEEAVAARRRTAPETDPYAPTGVAVGSLTALPSVELDSGYDSNPDRTSGSHRGSGFTTLAPHVEITSDWSRNALRGSLDGSLTRYWTDYTLRPRLAGNLAGRYDLSSQASLDAELRGNLDTELSSLDLAPSSNADRKLTVAYGATLGGSQRIGDVVIGLHGSLDRNEYEIQSRDRDYTTPAVTARVSYESGAPLTPFVEGGLDRRIHDHSVALDGTQRDSDGVTGIAGVAFALTGTLTGEAALGYGMRSYSDDGLPDLSAVLARTSLVWSPSALTTIGLRAATEFEETVQPGSPGAVARTVGVDVSHALRRNLIATASLAETFADYAGIDRRDDTLQATLGVEYRMTPTLAVRASYAYERVDSDVPGIDTTDNTVFVGIRVQR